MIVLTSDSGLVQQDTLYDEQVQEGHDYTLVFEPSFYEASEKLTIDSDFGEEFTFQLAQITVIDAKYAFASLKITKAPANQIVSVTLRSDLLPVASIKLFVAPSSPSDLDV